MLISDPLRTAEESEEIEIEKGFEGRYTLILEAKPLKQEEEFKLESSSPPPWCNPNYDKMLPLKKNKTNKKKLKK